VAPFTGDVDPQLRRTLLSTFRLPALVAERLAMTDTQDPAANRDIDLPRYAMSAFAELGKINLSSTDLPHVLQRVADLAKAVIPGVAEASVTLIVGDTAETAAFTGDLAMALDERQYAAGDAPCLAAATNRAIYLIQDTSTDDRWPSLCEAASKLGVRSTLSVGIPVQEVVAGLNLYSAEIGVFDEDAVTLADTFANYAAVALANAYLYSTTAALAKQMSAAMESRAVIEQAKGILMARQNISADDAFALLSRASQTSNRKLREIAAGIVTGTAPPNGNHRP
jgi:GAF domain-containing protein